MKKVLCLALGILCSCTPKYAPQTSAPTEDVQAAIKQCQDCLTRTSALIDDGQSEATTIALAAIPMCEREYNQAVVLMGWGLDGYGKEYMAKQLKARQLADATGAVLLARSRKSK